MNLLHGVRPEVVFGGHADVPLPSWLSAEDVDHVSAILAPGRESGPGNTPIRLGARVRRGRAMGRSVVPDQCLQGGEA